MHILVHRWGRGWALVTTAGSLPEDYTVSKSSKGIDSREKKPGLMSRSHKTPESSSAGRPSDKKSKAAQLLWKSALLRPGSAPSEANGHQAKEDRIDARSEREVRINAL